MGDTVVPAEFLGSTIEERLKMCRKLADEAAGLADGCANPEGRRSYLDLKRQWDELANELENEVRKVVSPSLPKAALFRRRTSPA